MYVCEAVGGPSVHAVCVGPARLTVHVVVVGHWSTTTVPGAAPAVVNSTATVTGEPPGTVYVTLALGK